MTARTVEKPPVFLGGIFLATEDVENCLGGKRWRFVYDRQDFASWWSHADEHAVRERFWGQDGVKPGDVVLDVGAAYGSYVLPALACGAAHVYAWAPDNGAPYLLLKSLEANGWRGRCTLIPSGLWDADGWVVAKSGPAPSEFYGRACVAAPAGTPLALPAGAFPVTTLDEMAAALGIARVDWLKIDVEGGECEVLRGGRETLRRFKPAILVEAHLFKDAAMEARVAAILEPLGYQAIETLALLAPEHMHVTHTLWRPR